MNTHVFKTDSPELVVCDAYHDFPPMVFIHDPNSEEGAWWVNVKEAADALGAKSLRVPSDMPRRRSKNRRKKMSVFTTPETCAALVLQHPVHKDAARERKEGLAERLFDVRAWIEAYDVEGAPIHFYDAVWHPGKRQRTVASTPVVDTPPPPSPSPPPPSPPRSRHRALTPDEIYALLNQETPPGSEEG